MKLEAITDFETLEDLLIYSHLPTERQISALIQTFNQFSSIPVKRVLDIGCGYGRHSRAWFF
jgi:2-polyprenyl-3-methyl-5-hydroxy-6-metoxy-1,4-benzoquinol methylase